MAKTLFQISQSQDESPLGLYASWPTPDNKLNFYDSSLTVGSGSKKIIPTVNGQVFDSIVDAFINFQNQSVSNVADFDIVWPTPNTVGRFRRVGFSLSTAGKIKATFSAEFTTEAELPNGGTLLDKEGFTLGYIDLVCTSTSGFFKTAGSASNIIEASRIYRISASGADYVSGPSSSVNNAITRFDGTTGKIIKSGVGTITDAGAVAGLTGLATSGTATFSGAVVNSSNTANTQSGSGVVITNATTAVTRLTNSGLVSVGGYANATAGRRNIIINATGDDVTILNEALSVTAANRIVTGRNADVVLKNGASIEMIYNTTTQRHQIIGGVGGGNEVVKVVAGENILPLDLVYISTGTGNDSGRLPGRMYKVNASNDDRVEVLGFSLNSVSQGSSGDVQYMGSIKEFQVLMPGKVYYASSQVPGFISDIPPSLEGEWVVAVGLAVSESELVINPVSSASAIYISDSEFVFPIPNNQAAPVSVTNLLFDPIQVRSFIIIYSAYREDSLQAKAQVGQLRGTFNSKSLKWFLSDDFGGENAGVEFSIQPSGQVQIKTTNFNGASPTGVLKYSIVRTFTK
jgi:hypothetical protein